GGRGYQAACHDGGFSRLALDTFHHLCGFADRLFHRDCDHADTEKGRQAGDSVRPFPCFRCSSVYILRKADNHLVSVYRQVRGEDKGMRHEKQGTRIEDKGTRINPEPLTSYLAPEL